MLPLSHTINTPVANAPVAFMGYVVAVRTGPLMVKATDAGRAKMIHALRCVMTHMYEARHAALCWKGWLYDISKRAGCQVVWTGGVAKVTSPRNR